jgi:phosphatidate phosphatase APP1
VDIDEIKSQIGSIVGEIGETVESAADRVRGIFEDDPFEILAYRGYGNANRAHIYGRVIEKPNVSVATDADSTLRNLLNTYRRAESDPLAFAELTVEYGDTAIQCKTDDEGFFSGWIDVTEPKTGEWEKYEVELANQSDDEKTITGAGEILVPPATARFGVISDIDDTVIQSRVTSFLQAARTVMLGNARTRLPFPGVSAFYEALRNGPDGNEKNPIFYVSSSPWNIYDVIADFMDIQKIPKGPLVLRDWDVALSALSSSRHGEHKGSAIRNLIKLYPEMPFILIGDTSQRDPEIYREIVGEFPERVKAIYIRDVNRTAERKSSVQKLGDEVLAAGSVLVLADDTLGAARHAADNGWINFDSIEHVDEEKRADEGIDDSKVPAPGGGEQGSGAPPTVIE